MEPTPPDLDLPKTREQDEPNWRFFYKANARSRTLLVQLATYERRGGEGTMVSWIVALAVGHGPDVSPCFWAYLDPGSSSMLFQVLIAGLLSALFCARSTLIEFKSAWFGDQEKG